ncbi:MAG TPA: ROK family protein [Pyrinomonadaceae bacterium]|nr:ROK family protein [Pyrinomonadaceae bacterium]
MGDITDSAKIRVGIEICTSALRAVWIDQDGKVGEKRTAPLNGSGETLPQLITLIGELKKEPGDFDKIGIAVPGLVDTKSGHIEFSAHFPEHSNVELVQEIREACGISASIENDANAAAYGEFILGAGRGHDNFFYVTLGEGVGGAFIFGGKVWRGASGFAGEFGYVPINSEGMRLEEVASTDNIIRRTRSRFHQDSTSSLNKLAEEDITLEAIISAANNDDDFAQMMLERTGIYVGSAIATVINLLNLERIVVGGEIMEAKHLVLNAIKERASELSFAPSFKAAKIVAGELGPFAAAAGAALLSGQSK